MKTSLSAILEAEERHQKGSLHGQEHWARRCVSEPSGERGDSPCCSEENGPRKLPRR